MEDANDPLTIPNTPQTPLKTNKKEQRKRLKVVNYNKEQQRLKTIVSRQIEMLLDRSYDESFTVKETTMMKQLTDLLQYFKIQDEEYLKGLSKEELQQLLKNKEETKEEEIEE